MGTFASEDFEGTEDTTLSTHNSAWTRHTSYSANSEITSGRLRVSTNSANSAYWHSASPASADYNVMSTVYLASRAGAAGPAGRMSTSANTMYLTRYNLQTGSTSRIQLYKFTTGTAYLLGAVNMSTWDIGETRTLTLKMSGTTIEAWQEGASSADISVTDAAISDAGKAGMRNIGGAAVGDSADYQTAYWEATEADAAGQPYRKRLGGVRFAAHNAGVW